MVESHVREEVFYREAMAMGLDQDDPMVRRRMRMKLEFMLEDLSGQDASEPVTRCLASSSIKIPTASATRCSSLCAMFT
jgi:hypothetical protein